MPVANGITITASRVMAGPNLQALQPMSVKDIALKAEDFEFNPFIPLKYWLRTADTLLREVSRVRNSFKRSGY